MADPTGKDLFTRWLDAAIGIGGLVIAFVTVWRSRRKDRRDSIKLEPVTQEEYQQDKNSVDKRFQQIEAYINTDHSYVSSALARLTAVIDEREKAHLDRLKSIEQRFSDILQLLTGKTGR